MNNNKSLVLSAVALVVGLIALVANLGYRSPSQVDQSQSLSGQYNVNNANPTFNLGADFGPIPVNVNWQGGKIGPGQNFGYYRNLSGTAQYVSNAEVSTDGTASSSYKIYAYSTTTAPTALFDFSVTPVNNGSTTVLINGFTFATSSTATTTSSDDTKGNGAGPIAGSVAFIPNGAYFIVRMVATNGAACTVVGVCPAATSTARGFNLPWRIFVHN